MPSNPPSTATSITVVHSSSKPKSIKAGIAAPTPNAIDSPADPAVWTTLFSRIVARLMPKARDRPRKIVIARTATGIDAETVIPTLSSRYNDEAPNRIPRSEPITTAGQVNSGRSALGGM